MNFTPKKAFTLIELLIVITIIGILSTLLFRTLADMISANGKIQQEKIMTQELITLQTTINNISEQYPIIDMQTYK
jgi:prepilin-type N-terminal cleavage/methylation domain-containing protein